jgi:hypothetical protein
MSLVMAANQSFWHEHGDEVSAVITLIITIIIALVVDRLVTAAARGWRNG